jgi:GT2 family glycosyltransferase
MLSIIIVNWKSVDYLKVCVTSIFKYISQVDFEVIIADNDSGDNLDQFKNQEKITLLELDKNYGFGKANNIAFEKARGENILFLNPDTEFVDSSLEDLLEYQNQNKDIGIIGCKILNSDGSVQDSVRTFPTLSSHILILLKLHRILSNSSSINKYLMKSFDYNNFSEVDQVMGAFMLTTKNIFEKLGGFDENYFIWYEEVDLCKNAINNGFKVVYNPIAQIKHHYSQSFKNERRLKKQMVLNKSMRYYFRKNVSLISFFIITLFSGISLLITLGVKLIFREKVVIDKKHNEHLNNSKL